MDKLDNDVDELEDDLDDQLAAYLDDQLDDQVVLVVTKSKSRLNYFTWNKYIQNSKYMLNGNYKW